MGPDGQLIFGEHGIPASEIKLAKILMYKPAPHCTAQSWSIYDQKTNQLLFGKMERERRECASITKIMTCYVVIKLMDRFNLKDSELVKVSQQAATIIGTSAELLEGDTLTIKQLMYGLMLPSGNDAAHALAEYFGHLLKLEEEKEEGKDKQQEERDNQNSSLRDKDINAQSTSSGSGQGSNQREAAKEEELNSDESLKLLPTQLYCTAKPMPKEKEKDLPKILRSPYVVRGTHFKKNERILYFLEEMNKQAEILGLKSTVYDSPHGLSNFNNKSTALDVAKLSTECMKLKVFREVCGTKFYQVKKGTNGNKKTYKWTNTHLMLGQRGINGIKTGITPAAGPCLCTSISMDGIDLIIVIICTKTMDIRWPETWKLANWAIHRLRTIEKFQNQKVETTTEPIQHKRLLNRIRHL